MVRQLSQKSRRNVNISAPAVLTKGKDTVTHINVAAKDIRVTTVVASQRPSPQVCSDTHFALYFGLPLWLQLKYHYTATDKMILPQWFDVNR